MNYSSASRVRAPSCGLGGTKGMVIEALIMIIIIIIIIIMIMIMIIIMILIPCLFVFMYLFMLMSLCFSCVLDVLRSSGVSIPSASWLGAILFCAASLRFKPTART